MKKGDNGITVSQFHDKKNKSDTKFKQKKNLDYGHYFNALRNFYSNPNPVVKYE